LPAAILAFICSMPVIYITLTLFFYGSEFKPSALPSNQALIQAFTVCCIIPGLSIVGPARSAINSTLTPRPSPMIL